MTPEPDVQQPAPLPAALQLAALGWRVVPITPHKKHPPLPAWQKAATTDPSIITNWWTGLYNGHGIGVACGAQSGVWVLDVDVAGNKQGAVELEKLVADHDEWPDTPTAQTGTGGWHYYFAWPQTGTITNGMSVNLGDHLDIRGEGGQVLAPPTIHPNGNPYAWCDGLSPWDIGVADAPRWLLDLLQRAATPPTKPSRPLPTADPDDGPAARFNNTHTWDELLAADGWELTGIERDGEQHWLRPLAYGPTDAVVSATVGYQGADVLVVFTTSVPWLPPAAYSRFGYYACRYHNGDRSAAARALRDGERAPRTELREIPNQPDSDPTDPGPWAVRDAAHTAADAEAADPLRAAIQIQAHRLINGWDFIHGVTDEIEAVWGAGDEILWPRSEPCLLVGPSGVGKSTLGQQVLRAHIGDGGHVLRYPVMPAVGRTLYLAMDRPAQIARSMARMFGADWEERLKDRLVVWRGPLPFSVVKQPEGLAVMCDEFGACSLFVDSIKDMAPKISDEETGSQINAAFQMAIVEGVDVFAIHHQRKAQGENKKPNKLSDVYGSQMMVNGAGSVILLWGEAGDPVVELSHLKQPMETIGPLTVTHDHYAGVTTADERTDAWQVVQGAPNGVDTPFVAAHMFGPEPSRNDIEKARRRLEKLVRDGFARVELGEKGGSGGGRPTMWYPITTDHAPITISASNGKTAGQAITGTYPQAFTARSRENEKCRSGDHDTDHDRSRGPITHPPYKEGGADNPAPPDDDLLADYHPPTPATKPTTTASTDRPDPDEEF